VGRSVVFFVFILVSHQNGSFSYGIPITLIYTTVDLSHG